MDLNIETYLLSLPEDVTEINVDNQNLDYLPSLARFKKLDRQDKINKLNTKINKLITKINTSFTNNITPDTHTMKFY